MTQEEKQLLLKDLCARLPYGVIVEYGCKHEGKDLGEKQSKLTGRMIDSFFGSIPIGMSEVYSLQPYLRPMSSMSEDEEIEFCMTVFDTVLRITEKKHTCLVSFEQINWLNAHHFDYRGLIEKGLALEAPEGMYNI